MSISFPGHEQQEQWSQYPEVLDLATSFYESAVSEPSEYLNPVETHKLESHPELGLVVVRNLFTTELVNELTAYAEVIGFKDYVIGDRETAGLFCNRDVLIGARSVDYFSSVYFKAIPELETILLCFNKYFGTLKFNAWGEPHIDDEYDGPVLLLAKGPGYIEISKTPIADDSERTIDNAFDKFGRDSKKGLNVKLAYSGGDTVIFDGRKRFHRGSGKNQSKPRFSVVAYPHLSTRRHEQRA